MHVQIAEPAAETTFEHWLGIDIRVGTVVEAEPYPHSRKPSLRLVIDFGPSLGKRRSIAQITRHYAAQDLLGRQVAAVVNFPPRQIGKGVSECLTLGFPDAEGEVVLITPTQPVPDGGRLF